MWWSIYFNCVVYFWGRTEWSIFLVYIWMSLELANGVINSVNETTNIISIHFLFMGILRYAGTCVCFPKSSWSSQALAQRKPTPLSMQLDQSLVSKKILALFQVVRLISLAKPALFQRPSLTRLLLFLLYPCTIL